MISLRKLLQLSIVDLDSNDLCCSRYNLIVVCVCTVGKLYVSLYTIIMYMTSIQDSTPSSPCSFHVNGFNILELLLVFYYEQVIQRFGLSIFGISLENFKLKV